MKDTQQDKILKLLQNMGNQGVNSYDLTYIFGIKQAPTRIKELKQQGYNIVSRPNKNRSVTYILLQKQVSNRTTEPITKNPWEEELVRVVKNGHVFWEKPEDLEPSQLNLL